MTNGYKVSVIVPVYNGEGFIEQSISSLLNQTLGDIEIIIINDQSTDGTEAVIKRLAEAYPDRIKWKTVENRGAGIARNHGLDMASGEYIAFADSDDAAEPDMLEKLYQKASSEQAEIAVCGYYIVGKKLFRENSMGDTEYYGFNIRKSPEMYVYGVPYLWNKIFKRSLIEKEHTRFKQLRIFEDLEFTYRLYLQANKIVKVDLPLYYYMKTDGNSLTARFSDKFFDIFPAIEALIAYFKDKGELERFKEYLLFIALYHMYIRMEMTAPMKDFSLKSKYIDECFAFLDSKFPDWRAHNYYFRVKKKNKRLYTSKLFWKLSIPFLKYGKVMIKLLGGFCRSVGKLKKNGTPGAKYVKYRRRLSIDQKAVLLDSQHGDDINGNMFYLLSELQKEEYSDFTVYVAVEAKRMSEFAAKLSFYGFNRAVLLKYRAKNHLKALASAKFLFADTGFPTFFIKREGQIYFNTWHGTPLKTLGRSTAEDFYNIGNLQKNFLSSDYLLYPSEFMRERMINDFMLAGISQSRSVMLGYPRNQVFFDKHRREKLRRELGFEGKQIIAYMPTWRGTLYNQTGEPYIEDLKSKLTELANGLNNDQLLYLNVHPYLKDKIDIDGNGKIFMFPKEYETYDFLNLADILITDYSSVFFDFANTGRRIILFTYDEEEYLSERGLYIGLSELPFRSVKTVEELLDAINSPDNQSYPEFLEKYASYDCPDASAKICRALLGKGKSELEAAPVPSNGKGNVLCSVNDFWSYSLNQRFFALANSASVRYNYFITFQVGSIAKRKRLLLKLPKQFNCFGRLSKLVCCSLGQRAWISLVCKFPRLYPRFKKVVDRCFSYEYKRLFAEADFEFSLAFGDKLLYNLLLFGQASGKKVLFIPSGAVSMRLPREIYDLYDKVIAESQDDLDKLKMLPDGKVRLINKASGLDELIGG